MNSFTYFLLFSALICGGLASPAPAETHSLVRHRRQLDFFQNTGISSAWDDYRKLIQELINNLNKAAQQARDAVKQFNEGLLEQARQCRERFTQGLNQLKDRVTDSFKKLQEKFEGSNSAIGECIQNHRGDAEIIYHDASEHMSECTDKRLQEGEDLIKKLSALGANGEQIATQAFAEMRNCTQQHSGNFLAVGTCIGSVALQTEAKGASFLLQSGLAIGRLNLYMSTLPASLEVCAGSSLVNAGMGTAKVLMDIGSCSTTSVINIIGGNSESLPYSPSLPNSPSSPSLPSLPAVDASSASSGASAATTSVSGPAGSASGSFSAASSSALNAIPTALPFPNLFI